MRTVHVATAHKQKIEEIVRAGVDAANKHYGISMPMPSITYNKTGRTAGVAHIRAWSMDLNSVLLHENGDAFIDRTPLHELAHLVCYKVYPDTLAAKPVRMTSTGRFKREKREVHGPRFYEVMHVMGVGETASRCHSFDTTNSRKQTDKSLFAYHCPTCQREWQLTAKRHNKMLAYASGLATYHYICKCAAKSPLVFSAVAKHAPAPTATKLPTTGPTGDSKLAKCWRLFNNYSSRSRAWMIPVFVNEADCTPAGAATYYALCKKMYTNGVI